MTRSERPPKAPKQRRAPDVSRAGLERAALGYLEKFDTSVSNLRRVLKERVRRARQRAAEPVDVAGAEAAIEQLLERYQSSGLLNDRRYASNLLTSLRGRGVSGRAAQLKLNAKGVDQALVQELISSEREEAEADPELAAAIAYVRKRRMGNYRRATAADTEADPNTEAESDTEVDPSTESSADIGSDAAADAELEPAQSRWQLGRKLPAKPKRGLGVGGGNPTPARSFRATPEAERRNKELAALARRGFSFEIARRALDSSDE